MSEAERWDTWNLFLSIVSIRSLKSFPTLDSSVVELDASISKSSTISVGDVKGMGDISEQSDRLIMR